MFKDLVEGIFRSGRRLGFTARGVYYDDVNAEKPAKPDFAVSSTILFSRKKFLWKAFELLLVTKFCASGQKTAEVLLREFSKNFVEGIFDCGRRSDFTVRDVWYDNAESQNPAKTRFWKSLSGGR